MKAVIMAGGRGTRIKGVCADRPKPMMNVCGKPILLRQVEGLVSCGVCDIIIVTGYMGEIIKEYFGDGATWGAHITYYEEDASHPLGTAGALFCMKGLGGAFILMCGDLVCDIDFRRLIAFHEEKRAMGALATILVHPNNHPYDSALVETEECLTEVGGVPYDTGRVIAWWGRHHDGTADGDGGMAVYHRNMVNSGIEIITAELLNVTKARLGHLQYPIDLDKDVLRPTVDTGRIFAMRTTEYICDMGTPERYAKVTRDVSGGIVAARNAAHKQRAVFFDRDDTLVRDAQFMNKADQLTLLDGAARAVQCINEAGYLAVVVTNQPVIARGEASWEDLSQIHARLETLLGAEGAYLDGIYVCPHHPDKGFDGERVEYKRKCDCRKPQPGLILTAARELNIDVSQSIMIGDSDKDVECGRRAGCKQSIQLHEGYTVLDAVQDVLH